MRVLVHTCCGVCLPGVVEALRGGGDEVVPLFYNPNIQPLLEFRKRLKAFRVLAESMGIPVEFDDTYDLELFFRTVLADMANRCALCYRLRLGETARRAAASGYEAFATTLAASPHQKHALIRAEGERAGEEHGVAFLYRDWRAVHEANVAEARRRSIFRQLYCGCVWSEEERYRETSKELYRGERQE